MPNIARKKIQYNSQTYEFFMVIYNDDITLTAPDLIVNDDAALIPSESISYVMIENSINEFIPKAEFEIRDSLNAIGNYLKAQNCRIYLDIQKDTRIC